VTDPIARPESAWSSNRRGTDRADRRRISRSGRRNVDPRAVWYWRRLTWLFAAYAIYMSIRSLPAAARRLFKREHPA